MHVAIPRGAGGTVLNYADKLGKVSAYVRGVLGSPDVIGVQEVDRLSTLQDLAARIHTDGGPIYDAALLEGDDPGDIDVGFLTRQGRIAAVTVQQFYKGNLWNDPNGSDILHDRPPLLLRGTFNGPGGARAFAVLNNHTKARSCVDKITTSCTTQSALERDRAKRFQQARDIANLVQAVPDRHRSVQRTGPRHAAADSGRRLQRLRAHRRLCRRGWPDRRQL